MAYDEIAERRALTALQSGALETALTILMKAYGDDIFRFCQSLLNNATDAQDVLQQVFLQAFKNLKGFKEQSTLRTWLYSIARNKCLDHIKKSQRLEKRIEFVDDAPERSAPSEPDANDSNDHLAADILQRCLDRLSVSAKTAVVLRFHSDYSYQEAAEMLNEKAGTLQARVARALPVLRRCVEENGVQL